MLEGLRDIRMWTLRKFPQQGKDKHATLRSLEAQQPLISYGIEAKAETLGAEVSERHREKGEGQ